MKINNPKVKNLIPRKISDCFEELEFCNSIFSDDEINSK